MPVDKRKSSHHIGGVSDGVPISKLLEWIRGKIREAEASLAARNEMERVWRGGTDKSWAKACSIHRTTSGKAPMTKQERLKESERHHRIAVKCRHELEMLVMVFDALSEGMEWREVANHLFSCAVGDATCDEWNAAFSEYLTKESK